MGLKKFLPFEKFVLQTKLTMVEVLDRIAKNVEPRKNFHFSFFPVQRTKPYEGSIAANNFVISRIIGYRNSFLPLIKGTVYNYIDKTEIAITMRPFIGVIIFMSFWLGTVGLVCISIIIAAFVQLKEAFQHGVSLVILIPFGMLIFGYGMVMIGFKTESKRSRKFLTELLEAS